MKAIVKKDMKSKVVAKKWFDGRLMAKIFIMTIQVPHPQDLAPNSPELSLLKFSPLAYHKAISWPPLWISYLFSQWPSWGPHTLFYSWAVLDQIYIHKMFGQLHYTIYLLVYDYFCQARSSYTRPEITIQESHHCEVITPPNIESSNRLKQLFLKEQKYLLQRMAHPLND